jgi:Rho termination factor, N-terminal domain
MTTTSTRNAFFKGFNFGRRAGRTYFKFGVKATAWTVIAVAAAVYMTWVWLNQSTLIDNHLKSFEKQETAITEVTTVETTNTQQQQEPEIVFTASNETAATVSLKYDGYETSKTAVHTTIEVLPFPSFTIRQLKSLAKSHKVPNYSRMTKAQLEAALDIK